ncbi:MAG: GNAT family N-acetyltransferase [Chitinophagaceae bacterium]|nr:GNAT family N-acetyltransferase [Chitinophagaceae bacterium]MCW5926200.1 GNAT family N-acetyltransferase [Chitinophagaceae bacterium]
MQVSEVITSKDKRLFLDLPETIYQNDPNWVHPLDKDIEAVFDEKKNPGFKWGRCTRWILIKDRKVIGRIAAFVNENKAYKYKQPTGGCGFFECIDNQDAADLLFDTAKQWLMQHGMQAMDGPVNFGETDMWWGLLVEGFSRPYYGMNYHPPYYKRLFERYGFTPLYEQISNRLDVMKPFPERFGRISEWVDKKSGYSFEHFSKKRLDKFVNDFIEIYNDAWQHFEGQAAISADTVRMTFNKIRPVLDEKLIWFSYINNEPASFVVLAPDANELIYNLNGKLNWLGKLLFLYNRYNRRNKRMRAIVMGTKQKYQNHGLESAMFTRIKEYVLPLKKYKEIELSWVGAFNTKMMSLHEATGAVFSKKHITYRYIFNPL